MKPYWVKYVSSPDPVQLVFLKEDGHVKTRGEHQVTMNAKIRFRQPQAKE